MRRYPLYGLEAINAYNGWNMAIAGALIVLSGLAVLSFIISQLHRVISLFEEKEVVAEVPPETEASDKIKIPIQIPTDIDEAADIVQPIVDQLDSDFELSDLYKLLMDNGFPHPHMSIKTFREADIILASGEGLFTWNR